MIDEKIELDGKEYYRRKILKGTNHNYVEYRNREIKKMKFFEVENGKLIEVKDKEDLKRTIEKNYIIKSEI